MRTSEPPGQLIRWELRLSELSFYIVRHIGNLNIKADPLSRLKFLRHTTAPLEKEIATFPDDKKERKEHASFLRNSDMSDYILLTNKSLQDPSLVPNISTMELREKNHRLLTRTIVATLRKREEIEILKREEWKTLLLARNY